MRGFLSGAIWGVVVSVVGLVALSLLSPLAPSPEVSTASPATVDNAPEPDESDSAGLDKTDPDLAEAMPDSLTAADSDQDTLSEIDQADTQAAEKPDVEVASPQAPAGDVSQLSAEVAVTNDEPVSAPAASDAPELQEDTATLPAADDQSSRPVTPQVTPDATSLSGGTNSDQTVPDVPADSEAAPQTADTAQSVEQPGTESAPVVSTEPAEKPAEPEPEQEQTAESAEPEPEAEPSATENTDAAPEVGATTTPEFAESPADITAPEPSQTPVVVSRGDGSGTEEQVAALPQPSEGDETLRPTIGKRVVPLTERDSEEPADSADQPTVSVPDEDQRAPIDKFATPFENPEDKPLMAIVLIDDEKAIGVEALKDFPYPLTFAINPTAPGAADKMARHRAAGFEVVALVNLPVAGTAQDAEVALSASFDALPEALAVIEGTGTGFQGNRELSGQVTAFAGSTGRGMITQGNGLNTVQKLAVRDGVPATSVFRDFDGAGQTPTVMRRFLDQAAFRARQEGGVIMLGRVRPDTISALLLWGLQDRANRVALAPVSAVLKASIGE